MLVDKNYVLGDYRAIDPEKAAVAGAADESAKQALASADLAGQFDALAKMAMFPAFMFACYTGLFLYFRSKGGYRAVDIGKAQH